MRRPFNAYTPLVDGIEPLVPRSLARLLTAEEYGFYRSGVATVELEMDNGILYLLLSAYTHLGCWKDTARRAVPQIDGSDPRIRGNYVRRSDAINKCYQVARQRKMIIFAVQNGGWCAAATNLNGYRKYGKASNCKNGKGGPWANDVYRITNPIKPALPKGISISSIA